MGHDANDPPEIERHSGALASHPPLELLDDEDDDDDDELEEPDDEADEADDADEDEADEPLELLAVLSATTQLAFEHASPVRHVLFSKQAWP